MTVRRISYREAKVWITGKHYAKRTPSISYAFGLFDDRLLIGVVTYGIPASPFLCSGICGHQYSPIVLELNRLCLSETKPENSASFLVGRTLKLLPSPSIVVSYADTSVGHIGYVYQATNFIYTGLSDAHNDRGQGGKHSRHSFDIHNELKPRPRKHRYVYFLGSKKQKKSLKSSLRYGEEPYPKGATQRQESPSIPIQQDIFGKERGTG
jgi:hypothetical protein